MRIRYEERVKEWVVDRPTTNPNSFYIARLRPMGGQQVATSATNVAMQFRVPDRTAPQKSDYVQLIFDMRVDLHKDGIIRNVLRASPKAKLQPPFGVVPATFHNSGCERLSALEIPDDHPLALMVWPYLVTLANKYVITFATGD